MSKEEGIERPGRALKALCAEAGVMCQGNNTPEEHLNSFMASIASVRNRLRVGCQPRKPEELHSELHL